jgi:serine/threonine protein phosphatase PrpC
MIDEDRIAGVLMRHPDNPAEKLVEAALDAGGEDNVTVVIIGSEVQPSRVRTNRAAGCPLRPFRQKPWVSVP